MLRNRLKTHGLGLFVCLTTFALGAELTVLPMNPPECETLNVTPPLAAPKSPPSGTGHYCSIRCRVHGTPLEQGQAEIVHRLLGRNRNYDQACMTLFPNANSWVEGECMLGEKKVLAVAYCPDCRIAEEIWKYPPPPPPYPEIEKPR